MTKGKLRAFAYKSFKIALSFLGTPLSTTNYGYDNVWKDKLVSYNGTAITSDAMGNPLNAVSLNVIGGLEELELEWNGRQLSAVTRNAQRYEYNYDSDGMRTEIREYNRYNELETVCHYAWQNGKLVGLDIRDGSGEVRFVVKMIYDDAGESTGYIVFDEENSKQDVMHFQKNLQGDITGVFCESYGREVLTYKYDAWGNITPQFTGGGLTMLYWAEIALLLTPITYRGYMYDPYIGMYYLQSRYYNPAYGRFLNADAIIKTGKSLGANIFAYCENNPVNYVDYDGRDAKTVITNILYLLVVIAVMKNDLKDRFDYIFDGAISFSFEESTINYITDLIATFTHKNGVSYDVCIKLAHIDAWRDWQRGEEHLSHTGHTGEFLFGLFWGLLGFVSYNHIGTIVSVVTIVADIYSFVEGIEQQKYIDFVHNKIEYARDHDLEYIVFVRAIYKNSLNAIGTAKKETIYDCIEG